MRVLIRADASVRIGSGHVMRCLALAGALAQQGATVVFACRTLPGHLCDWIEQRGFGCLRLPATAVSSDAVPWYVDQQDDAAQLAATAGDGWDWCVVDHYGLSAEWERQISGLCRYLLALDDAANRPHAADVLLDQNLDWHYHADYRDLLPASASTLLGPDYALLRPEFAQLHQQAQPRQSVRRILLAFGGGDAGNETGRTLGLLRSVLSPEVQVSVVIGAAHPALQAVLAQCVEAGYECAVQVDDMAQRMLAADLAIGAAGVIAWERCCLGLPALMITLADNQAGIAAALHAKGAALALGRASEVTATQLAQALAQCQQPGGLAAMSGAALALVDGQGAARVARAMASF
mgnify:CR=1 FL=1